MLTALKIKFSEFTSEPESVVLSGSLSYSSVAVNLKCRHRWNIQIPYLLQFFSISLILKKKPSKSTAVDNISYHASAFTMRSYGPTPKIYASPNLSKIPHSILRLHSCVFFCFKSKA